MIRSLLRAARRALPALLLLAALPAAAAAQGAVVRGTVRDPEGRPVAAVQVSVAGTRLSTVTGASGTFVLQPVPAGTHQLRASRAGYATATQAVTVAAGATVEADVRLSSAPIELDAMVISASRQAERLTQAPATITRIGPEVLENVVGNSFVGALKQAKGLDYIQVGATSVAINARGFNSSFNNRMLMMEDGRVAVLPENGLPVGQLTALPKIDLAGLEVIVGPGAALYGADASNGVLTLQTKDPRDFPGTTVEVTGGTRSYRDVQFRHAGTAGGDRWGYKVAGEFQDADEWRNRLRYGTGGIIPETAVGGGVDWDARVWRTTGGVTRYFGGDARLEALGGIAETNGVGQTNVGRNQLVDWRYQFQQLRYTSPRWYATAYRTESDAGKSYAINRFSEFRFAPANAGRTDEEIRQMSDWPSNGQLYAAEVQNNFRVAPLLNTKVIWGGQYRHDKVSSDRQWLTDRLTGEDLSIGQWGVYAQTETPLLPQVTLLLAGRYDDHESYDPQWSPKVGVVVTPVEGQSFRATYNRAFKSPTTLQTSFYIPDFVTGVGVFGNTDGFQVRRTTDGFVLADYKPLVPEENQTWEVGWKGVFDGRLFIDVTGYRSRYRDFLSPLTTIAFPALGSRAYRNGEPVLNENGAEQAVLTYFNLGTAKMMGIDAGVDYAVSNKVTLSGTMSWADLRSIDEIDIRNVLGAPDTARIREASVLNAPELKWTLGARVTDFHGLNAGVTVRYVDDYFFASGINKGLIPTFTTVDLSLGWRVPGVRGALINANLSNAFTCRGGQPSTTYVDEESCGFGKKHAEMINMPELGAMLTVGVRYDVR